MFIAIDQHGKKVNPLDTPEEELRLLSKSKMIFCPECQGQVRYASGEQVTAHFKHVHSPNCSYESEPETEEHLKGKMLIRNWLIERYSDVHVEFEYKIKETNQRADVMAIFPGGNKIAFEIQCSKIQGSVWKERHALYKKAAIKDFWILGQSVHKYRITNNVNDTKMHQLISLASSIYEKEGSVLFLDTNTATLKGIYKHKFEEWHSSTILKVEEEVFPLSKAKIFKNLIGTESIENDFMEWFAEKQRLEQQYKKELEDEIREQEKRKLEFEKLQRIRNENSKRYFLELESVTLESIKARMTNIEKSLFDNLLKKHGFNDDNFPGVFNVLTSHNFMIDTPHQLWQLWIFDKYIYRMKNTHDKIWVPKIKDEFYHMFKKGIYRLKYKLSDSHFSFAIYDYFEKLNILDIVKKLGNHSTKYHQIYNDVLPPLTRKEVHKYVALYLSVKNNSILEESIINDEIKESVILYKDFIKEYRVEEAKKDGEQISSLEYIKNLLLVQSDLGNDWEREFISKLYTLKKNGNSLSEKQQCKVTSIAKRIETKLGISLVKNY